MKTRKLIPLVQSNFKMKIIKDLGMLQLKNKTRKYRYALFECNSCGYHETYTSDSARYKNTTVCLKCSYKNRGAKTTRHKETHTRLYRIFIGMRERCNNPIGRDFHNYGGRGISVCDEWNDFIVFRDWANSNGYSDELSIDRIDNYKGYNPSNCRWANDSVQVANRRMQKRNKSGYIGVEKAGGSYSLRVYYEKNLIISKAFSNIHTAAIVRDTIIKLYDLPHTLNLASTK